MRGVIRQADAVQACIPRRLHSSVVGMAQFLPCLSIPANYNSGGSENSTGSLQGVIKI